LESLNFSFAFANLVLGSSDLNIVSVHDDFSLNWDSWNLSESDNMFLSAIIDFFGNLILFSLVNLDEGLVSVNPMSVVATFARLVLHDDNLLSGLSAGLDDRLILSDLFVVNLDLFLQISMDFNSSSFLDS